jgi:hypothetical protein
MKVFNPKSKKNEDLFETLIPTFTVGCTTPNIVNGDKGCAVYIVVSAQDEESAKNKAMANEEFMSHIYDKKKFDRKHLVVFKPTGSYVIGKVDYYEGDPRL